MYSIKSALHSISGYGFIVTLIIAVGKQIFSRPNTIELWIIAVLFCLYILTEGD